MSELAKRLAAAVIGILAALIVLGLLSITVFDIGSVPSASVRQVEPLAVRVPGAAPDGPAPAVLRPVGTGAPAPAAADLRTALLPLIDAAALGSAVSVQVVDPLTGHQLLGRRAAAPRVPASTAKLLTAAAALSLLGPESTLPTRVVGLAGTVPASGTAPAPGSATAPATARATRSTPAAGGSATGGTAAATPNAVPARLSLVGGGDVLLSSGAGSGSRVNGRAGLATLAARTATALKSRGVTRATVTFDDTLFGSQTTAPGWSASDIGNGFVAPVQPLEVNAGRLSGDRYAKRSADPALRAARAFARALTGAGIAVSGEVRRGPASASAQPLAEVRSAPIAAQVEYALAESDNTVAEALARLVGIAAKGESGFAGAGRAVLQQVRGLGVPVTGAVLADGSGLADGSAVPATALTGVLVAATGPDHPQLRPLLSGLPVAGVSGTLATRFEAKAQAPARGTVRAKTGTLIGVSSLAGTVVDADGRLLVFAAMADEVRSTGAARLALDKLATRLARCGCH